jgi:hypothetical protein
MPVRKWAAPAKLSVWSLHCLHYRIFTFAPPVSSGNVAMDNSPEPWIFPAIDLYIGCLGNFRPAMFEYGTVYEENTTIRLVRYVYLELVYIYILN